MEGVDLSSLSPYENLMYYYFKIAQTFQYSPTEIDNSELELMLDMLAMGKVDVEGGVTKKKYIDEVMF